MCAFYLSPYLFVGLLRLLALTCSSLTLFNVCHVYFYDDTFARSTCFVFSAFFLNNPFQKSQPSHHFSIIHLLFKVSTNCTCHTTVVLVTLYVVFHFSYTFHI